MADAGAVAALTFPQRLEFARIEGSAGVVAGSLRLEVEGEVEMLTFDIATEPTVEPPAADVRDVETMHFVYRAGRRFGETAPTNVLCGRADFPRGVGHLCAGEPGCAAAPCLAIGGIQPVYERAGIEAIMVRLRDFLRDAKTGTLMADGWEPVPFGVDQEFRPGELSPRFFQEHAAACATGGTALGVAISFERDEGAHVVVFPQVLEAAAIASGIAFRNDGAERRGIPWIFLWPSSERVETEPIFEAWRTGLELRVGMRRIGVDGAFDAAVGDLLNRDVGFRCHRPPAGGKGLVVVLGVWRPAPIMADFFGYSDDPAARRLELRAFMVSQDLMKEIVADDARVETIVGDHPPTPELLRWVAGVDRLPPIAMLGVGALGSAVFNNLVRSGLDDAVVHDSDRLHAHNLARHTARLKELYKPKVEHAEGLMRGVARDSEATVTASRDDLAAVEPAAFIQAMAGRLVVDATADERVRLRMDELRAASDVTIVRTEMLHSGRLGVTFVSPAGGPSMSDMMLSLIASAPDDPAVAAWLDDEARNPLGPDPMLYGFGCASQTVHLANHVVEQHASVATAEMLGGCREAGVSINPLDAGFLPQGRRWLPVGAFATLVPPTEAEWSIRVSPRAMERMSAERLSALPNETGGYLYGAWEPTRGTVTVLVATGLPPGSVATPERLELGAAGATAEERRLVRRTRQRIHLCGTWHSHPAGSARMSARDYAAMTTHHARDEATLSPTLMVIVADGDVQAHLRVP